MRHITSNKEQKATEHEFFFFLTYKTKQIIWEIRTQKKSIFKRKTGKDSGTRLQHLIVAGWGERGGEDTRPAWISSEYNRKWVTDKDEQPIQNTSPKSQGSCHVLPSEVWRLH